MSRAIDLSAVVISAPPLPRIRLQEVPRPISLASAQVVAIPQVRQSPHSRPEGVMSK